VSTSVATPIRKQDLAKLRVALEAKHAELASPRSRDVIAVEKAPDEMDEIQRAAERELAIHNLNRETTTLRSVRAALERIADRSYGTCLRCDDAINPKRLAAVPWAEYCIDCQAALDAERALKGMLDT
jgi:DnaK suppressor protein